VPIKPFIVGVIHLAFVLSGIYVKEASDPFRSQEAVCRRRIY
jgi:uncharacterized membrane protein (DUF485 family)